MYVIEVTTTTYTNTTTTNVTTKQFEVLYRWLNFD